MQFIYKDPIDPNSFQRGWNTYMALVGQKRLAEREQRQQEQFKQEMGLAQKKFALYKEAKEQEIALDKAKLTRIEAFKKMLDEERKAGKPTPQRWMDLWYELNPEEKAKDAAALEMTRKKGEITEARQERVALGRHELSKKLAQYKMKLRKENPDALGMRERQLLDKELTQFAITIESDPTGPGAKEAARFYNTWVGGAGTSLYVTQRKKKLWGKGPEETVRIDLPMMGDIQVTVADIRTTMKEENMTLNQVLEMLGAIE